MSKPDNIFLIGPMGAGKTTVGRRLAKKKKLEFIDCDQEIEKRTGVTISLIFEIEGEEGFRKREKHMIKELSDNSGTVIATGGGVILDAENRKRLRKNGYVIYLKATVGQLLKRTSRDNKRPLLNTEDPRKRMEDLLSEREPYYEKTANLVINTENKSIQNIVNEICKHPDLK